jgi:hypothetical protein
MSNAHLIDGSESVWSFGQVLPVVLLGLVVMNVFDAAKGLLVSQCFKDNGNSVGQC